MTSYKKSVENVYAELNNCIILGLTGRTGSGCSTTAKILNSSTFKQLNLPSPKYRDFKNAEERKESIIYKYIQNNWKPFIIIEASSVILSFVFEKTYDDFKVFITNLVKNNDKHNFRINGEDELLKNIEGLRSLFENNNFVEIDTNLTEILNDGEKLKEYYLYYTETIRKYKECFFNIFKDYSCFESKKSNFSKSPESKAHLYTYLMQLFGNNLRCSCNPYESKFNEDSFFTVAKRISNIIQIICKYRGAQGSRICIDAVRNPYEAHYLRDLYKSFYLVSVSTDDEERRRRLSYLDSSQLISLDEMEYPSKEYKQGQLFYQQSIAECLQISDIHLYNPHSENKRYEFITRNLVRYIALILHPGLVTPTSVERCMQMAFNAKLNSGCLSRQVGAVITDENYYIKAIGWNDVPQGQVPCNLRSIQNFFTENDSTTFSDFELKDNNFTSALKRISNRFAVEDSDAKIKHNIPYCFKDIYNGMKNDKNQVYTRSLHAEENAFLQASKFGGEGIIGGKLFVTASPCELCSKKSYQLGIREIYYIDPYPGIASSHILKFGDSAYNPKLNLFYGAIGNAYVSLYMQRFAFKDELHLSTGINMKEIAKQSSAVKTLDYDAVRNKDIQLELIFNSRNEIEFVRKVQIESLKDNLSEIQKAFSWTGSTYEKTIVNQDSQEYNIVDECCLNGINYYTIKPHKCLNKGDIFEYNVKTLVRDEREVMRPFLSYYVKHLTEHLELRVKFNKSSFKDKNAIKNITIKQYADIDRNTIFKTEKLKSSNTIENDTYFEYFETFDNPNLFYTYSIEWTF